MMLLNNFIELFMESAPWLILGFFVAGLMKALVPQDLLARHLGAPGFFSVLKAALLGAPLPLCSCGVIPAAIGLRRAGASKAATTSFLISTPETGVDSIAISYALLGPFMAVIRPIAAVVSAITAGLLVGTSAEPGPQQPSTTSPESSCCESEQAHQPERVDYKTKIKSGLRFTFVDLVHDIALWLLIGLAIAAAIQTFVPQQFLVQWGDGFAAFAVMALIGVPMYICATASTPIAAGLLFSGVSPGAVLVFMLVGPATNIATIGLVKAELGTRALVAYLVAVVGVGFGFGYLTNFLVAWWGLDFQVQAEQAHQMVATPLVVATSLLLAVLLLVSMYRRVDKLRVSVSY